MSPLGSPSCLQLVVGPVGARTDIQVPAQIGLMAVGSHAHPGDERSPVDRTDTVRHVESVK